MEVKGKILGKVWRFLPVPGLYKKYGAYGDCDDPSAKGKAVRFDSDMDAWNIVDTLLHECMHAGFPCLDEEYVREFSTNYRKVLEYFIRVEKICPPSE